ncbi:MAG TPA: AsmA-like C-terminal domain-containing protein, partial [Thermodesulfobacteriota bacterium]|nr:AsmA-like C-terminal domain-containing protein [Thermodesulfobacteriota bacterium]
WVKAKGRIYCIGSKEMGMEAEASTSRFDIAAGKKFIPFRIIVPAVSDRLFRSEGKGSFQAVSVKLSGKMPEIDHCDQLANAHVLSVEAKLDGAELKLPWDFPPLENLTGHLLFQKGDLHLREVEGRIFHSTLGKVNGTFHELLHIPMLQIECQGKLDLKDLPSFAKIEGIPEDFRRTLSSIRVLSGEAQYSLSAKGVLASPIHFQQHGSYHLSRTRFLHPQIPFPVQIGESRLELSDHDLKWSETKVEFEKSSLKTRGLWKHGEKEPSFEIMVEGRVDLRDLFALLQTPLSPEEVRSKIGGFEPLSGISQISFKGNTIPGTSLFSYEGEFIPKDVSLLEKGNPIPLVLREGTVSFSDSGVGFSRTKIQSGSSSLTLDGQAREGNMNLSAWGSIDLKQLFFLIKSPLFPEQIRSQVEGIQELDGGAEVRLKWQGEMEDWIDALKEGEVRLKSVDLQHRAIPVPLSHIDGLFFIAPGQIRVDELKGNVGDSPVAVSGMLLQRQPPSSGSAQEAGGGPAPSGSGRLSFQISSPSLDLDPLFPKKEGTSSASFERIRGWLSDWSVDGKIKIDRAKYRSLRCQDLKLEMETVDGTWFVRPLQFKGDGGDFWGEGWVKATEKGIRMEIKPRFSNMEAKAFLRALFQKGEEEKVEVTGRVHIDKAELRGEGQDFQKMKESLSGNLRFEIENGVIERFNILSKIFSILNVSQLLKGRLPDLKTKGLPFRQILANIDIREGVASTDDFLVDSDAMRITLLGKIDLGRNLIDVRIGVHPLVTVDTLLSSVPIAGYILTGEDKGFISYFYQVKGNLDDPKIEPIPFKFVEETTWGVVKRLLQTPLRPFQRTPSSNNKERNGKGVAARSSELRP